MEKEKKYEITPIDKNEYKLNDYNKHEIEIGRPEKLMYIMKDKLNSISEEKEKNTCYECKHFTPIISQGGAYKCLKKDRYFDYEYYKDCELFEQDIKTLREKEERIWM